MKEDKSLDLVTLSRGEEFNNSDSFNDEHPNKQERVDTKEGPFVGNNINTPKEADPSATLKFNDTGDFGQHLLKRQAKGPELIQTPEIKKQNLNE